MNLQDTMMLYGATLGKRRSNRQKELFRQQLKQDLSAAGLAVHDQEYNGRFYHLHNLVAGDVDRASTVFVVPYDTLTRTIVACEYYPFHPELTLREERRDLIARLALAVLAFVAAYFGVLLLGGWPGWAVGILLTAAGLLVLHVIANRFNFNRSSAAVAAAVALARQLGANGNAAFAFCDRSASGYEGYRLLASHLPTKPAVVILDSLAQGEKLVLAHTETCTGRAQRLEKELPGSVVRRVYGAEQSKRNLLALFPNGMVLTSGSIENGEFVVHNTRTPRDVGLDLSRLQKIVSALTAFAAGQND